jgi:Kdo2-lipid IVA lauroyltransferase/acyltransferase
MESSILYYAARTLLFILKILPKFLGIRTLAFCATLFYWLDSKHRRIAEVNLRIAFPRLSRRERRRIAVRSFQATSLNLLELSRMPSLTRDRISSLAAYDCHSGLNNYLEAVRRGKPILYLTGHFSSWELLPTAHALHGYPLSFVTRPLDNLPLEKYLTQIREAAGNQVISKRSAGKEILRCLRSAGSVGLLLDQNTDPKEAVYADLFGLPAATNASLAILALRTEATVLPGYLTLMKNGRYSIKFLPPLDTLRTGDHDRDVRENTALYNRIVESIIREQPESWLWGHKRWHYQNEEPPGLLYRLSDAGLENYLKKAQKIGE